MSSNPKNQAAWLVGEQVRPLEIKESEYTSPGPAEILIRNRASAINPVDCFLQALKHKDMPFPFSFPAVLGFDVAGEVVEVGSDVKRFKPGDRITGMCLGCLGPRPIAEAGFQEYVVLPAVVASHIPTSMSFEDACVIPLCLSTAATGMFDKTTLALAHPKVDPQPTGKTVLVWGAASSVGCNAVQLAVSAGYEVIATCSAKNFDLAKKLGAKEVYDYTQEGAVEQIVAALKKTDFAGCLDAIHRHGAFEKCLEVVKELENGNKTVSTVVPAFDPSIAIPDGVKTATVFGSNLKDNEVGPAVFEDYLPKALEQGKFVPAPAAEVVGRGLEFAQVALDKWSAGISAKKIVFSL